MLVLYTCSWSHTVANIGQTTVPRMVQNYNSLYFEVETGNMVHWDSFSSDFGHFILKMVENAKKCVKKKDAEISSQIFRLRGTRSLRPPPLSTPMLTLNLYTYLGIMFHMARDFILREREQDS